MKKLFLSLMLVAAVAFGFTSCNKTTSSSDTHSQTFTLGETTYDIDNAITIENMKYDGSDTYNAIVLSQGQMIGNNGGEGRGVVLFFKGKITAGTYNLTGNDNNYPKYVFASLTVEDIVNFDFNNLDDEESYFATSGSFTLEINDNTYTITTDGIEVENAKDPAIVETSSVDYEGGVLRYILADVEEGNINGVNIVTAGATKFTYLMMEQKVVCFITEEGDMLGYIYQGSSIPTGTIENAALLYVSGMDINNGLKAGQGTITIEKNDEVYTVDVPEVTIDGQQYTLHYVGTLPFFDFPF